MIRQPAEVRWFDAADREGRSSLRWSRHPSTVIPLDVGEMGCNTPEPVLAALMVGAERSDMGYAPLMRHTQLVQAIRSFSEVKYGWHIDEGVIFTISSVLAALDECLRLFAEPLSPVLAIGPLYPGIREVISERGHPVQVVDLDHGDAGFYLDSGRLESRLRGGARSLVVTSPHSPTGHVFTAAEVASIVRLLERYRVTAYVDEVYAPLVYPGSNYCPIGMAAAGRARVFAFGSVSKAWNLASLKASWVICPSVGARNELSFLSTKTLGALGALAVRCAAAALTECHDWIDEVSAQLAQHATLTAAGLGGVSNARTVKPEGGMFAWAQVRTTVSPAQFLYRHARVAVGDGQPYGARWGQWIRLNLSTHPDMLNEAVDRMAGSLNATS